MARALKIVLVRKGGTRKDGNNYYATCTICSGSKRDLNLFGMFKEEATELGVKHTDASHGGKRTI